MTNALASRTIGWLLVLIVSAVAALVFRHNLATMPAPTEVKRTGHAVVGQSPPDVRFDDLNGRQTTLKAFRGHPLWLNFFATWCGPCKIEMPEIQRRFEQHRKDGLVVLGVDEEEDARTVRAFASMLGLSFPLVIDQGEGTISYGVSAIPTSIFIDASGTIRAIHVGQMQPRDMDSALAQIIK